MWCSDGVTLDNCRQSTDGKLTELATRRYFPADVIKWSMRHLELTRSTCSDVAVASCSTCWRRYGDVIMKLVTWRSVVTETETTDQLHDVWMKMDRYKQQMLRNELQGKWTVVTWFREKERQKFIKATLNNQHSHNKLNVTCGRLPEKANAQPAGHLMNKNIRNKHTIHNYTYWKTPWVNNFAMTILVCALLTALSIPYSQTTWNSVPGFVCPHGFSKCFFSVISCLIELIF